MIDNIFGQQIHFFDIKSFDEIQNELIKYCYQIKKNDPSGVNRSNAGGWQSPPTFPRNEILFSTVQKSIIDYFTDNKILKEGIMVSIINMWININQKGTYNHTHSHPRCDMSGVLWIKIPENSGVLKFENGCGHAQDNLISCYSEYVQKAFKTYSTYNMNTKPGRVCLFPADLRHCVEQNMNRQDRISVSFNIRLKNPFPQ